MNRSPRVVASTAALVAAGMLNACASTRTETSYAPTPDFSEPAPALGLIRPADDRLDQDAELHFAVAISGGGHRAANFGVGVLLGLEDTRAGDFAAGDALAEVDVLSTVSGGGFAAGAYVSSLHDVLRGSEGRRENYSLRSVLGGSQPHLTDPDMSRHLERGYRDDLFSAANPFSWTSWRVWFTDLDRGDLLEKAIDCHLLGYEWRFATHEDVAPSLRLRDVFVPETADAPVLLPYWITNASAFENGAIFPFTPEHLLIHEITSYTHRTHVIHLEAPVASSEHQEFLFDMPMSVGVTASGAFPGPVAATTLGSAFDPHNPYLHLVDGGVGDNLGVQTALRVLEQHPSEHRRVLLVVDAFPGALGPFSKASGSPTLIDTGKRLMTVMLDTWRGRYRELTRRRCEELGIDVFFVAFEDLAGEHDVKAMQALDVEGMSALAFTDEHLERVSAGIQRLREPQMPSSQAPRAFELLRAVPTDYNISEAQQSLLIAGGRLALERVREELLVSLLRE